MESHFAGGCLSPSQQPAYADPYLDELLGAWMKPISLGSSVAEPTPPWPAVTCARETGPVQNVVPDTGTTTTAQQRTDNPNSHIRLVQKKGQVSRSSRFGKALFDSSGAARGHIVRNRDSQFQEFPSDAGCSPEQVGCGHLIGYRSVNFELRAVKSPRPSLTTT